MLTNSILGFYFSFFIFQRFIPESVETVESEQMEYERSK